MIRAEPDGLRTTWCVVKYLHMGTGLPIVRKVLTDGLTQAEATRLAGEAIERERQDRLEGLTTPRTWRLKP